MITTEHPIDLSVNPATGERLRWHVLPAESGGTLARAELWCRPGGGVPMLHVHPRAEERFEVLGGRLGVDVGDRHVVAGPGEHVAVPAGAPHRWIAEGTEELHVFVELDPPGAFDEQIETFFALGRRGLLRADGDLSLLLSACVALPHLADGYGAGAPYGLQRILLGATAGLARLTGHHRQAAAARAEARERLAALRAARRRTAV